MLLPAYKAKTIIGQAAANLFRSFEEKTSQKMTDGSSSPAPKPAKPKLPIKVRFFISLLSAVTDASRRSDGTINRRLLSLVEPRAAANPNPVRGVRTVDLTLDPARNLWIRLFLPEAPPSGRRFPLVVFFHGGGFAFLSPSTNVYDVVCRRIARKLPAVLVSVNYRLAPEHRFPAPYVDGVDALRFIDSGGIDAAVSDLVDSSSCFLAGDSAGANIAHHVARRWAAAGAEWKKVRLSGIVLIQPFFGGEERTGSEIRLTAAPVISTERTDWLWRAFLPDGEDRDHEAANVLGPRERGELEKGFPPAMVVVGGHDPLQDWQQRYCERLRARGKEVLLVEYPEAIHAFYIFPELVESKKVIGEIGCFIRSRIEEVE